MIFHKIVQTLEELVYHFIVWIILVPKTFYKVLFYPKWIFDFVENELLKEREEQFNDYLSPILFWIIIALLPYMINYSRIGNITKNFLNLGNFDHQPTFLMLCLISPILIFTIWVHIFKKMSFNKRELQSQIYSLFYIFAPFELFFLIIMILTRHVSYAVLFLIALIFIICLFIYQFLVMHTTLNSSRFKTLSLILISNFCTIFLIMCVVKIWNTVAQGLTMPAS